MKWSEIWGRFVPSRLVIYADFIDPFCYIGFHNARRAAAARKIDLEWRGFELNPDTPIEGSHLVPSVNSDVRMGMWASVKGYAQKSGLTLVEPTYVPNSRMAHLWVLSVKRTGVKNSLIERIYQAYLSDKKDIGNMTVLLEIARELGLPEAPLRGFSAPLDASPLEKFRQEAVAYRFAGMPGFRIRGRSYFGALSEDAWRTIL